MPEGNRRARGLFPFCLRQDHSLLLPSPRGADVFACPTQMDFPPLFPPLHLSSRCVHDLFLMTEKKKLKSTSPSPDSIE